MNAVQWLNRARHIDREIDILLAEKQRAKDRLLQITQSYTRSEAQTSKDPHKMDRIVELENQIDQKVDLLYETQIEIGDMIGHLENQAHREALTGYYLSMMTWERVAVEMHYSFHHVMRIRKEAIREVEALLNG